MAPGLIFGESPQQVPGSSQMASLGHKHLIEKKKLRKRVTGELFEQQGASRRLLVPCRGAGKRGHLRLGCRPPGPSGRKAEARAGPSPQTRHEVENGKVSRLAVRVGQK